MASAAFVTSYDAEDPLAWSGTPFHMGRALGREFEAVDYIGRLSREHRRNPFGRLLALLTAEHKRYRSDRIPRDLKRYAREIEGRLESRHEVVISPSTLPIAYLDCAQPIVTWVDATFAAMVNFYPDFAGLDPRQIENANRTEQRALERTALAVYSSEWAARSAIETYGLSETKVRVIPFGANLESGMPRDEVTSVIDSRVDCKLLFLGVDWDRKGGPLALSITEDLRRRGVAAQLDVVGCDPGFEQVPDHVTVHGFVPSGPHENSQLLRDLLRTTRFLLLPTRAECYGIVFCEASSFGVPSIATAVGGVPSAVRDAINGCLLPLDAGPEDYADRIEELINDTYAYRDLALSSFEEYQTRLNWRTACRTLRREMASMKLS